MRGLQFLARMSFQSQENREESRVFSESLPYDADSMDEEDEVLRWFLKAKRSAL